MLLEIFFVQNSSWCDCVNVYTAIRGVFCKYVIDWWIQILWVCHVSVILLACICVLGWKTIWNRSTFYLIVSCLGWTDSSIDPVNIWTLHLQLLMELTLIIAAHVFFVAFFFRSLRHDDRRTINIVLIVILRKLLPISTLIWEWNHILETFFWNLNIKIWILL